MPHSLSDCHCVDCRRGSGAAYVTWGTVPREHLKISQGSVHKVHHADRVRSFAACCGTPLFFEDNLAAEEVELTIATLDHPECFSPEWVIWMDDKLPWVVVDPSLPLYSKSRDSSS